MKLRLAVRLPILQILFVSIQRRGQEAALFDRARFEAFGEVLTSEPAVLCRQLRSYRNEMPRLTVIRQAAVL